MTIALRRRDGTTRARALRVAAIPVMALVIAGVAGTAREAAAALPPGNTVAQWNKIAEDTVVGSGAFQAEGFIYTAYASRAVYNAVVAIEGGFEPLDSTITAPAGASVECAAVEAAYRTLRYYFSSFPVLVANLDAAYVEALSPSNLDGCTADGGAGTGVGLAAAREVVYNRTTGPSPDGRMTPIAVTSSFPTLPPGPGAWRRRSPRRRRRGSGAFARLPCRVSTSSCPIRRRRCRATTGSRRSTRSRPTARRPGACAATRRRGSPGSGRRTCSASTTAPGATWSARAPTCCRRRGCWRWSTSSAPMRSCPPCMRSTT